MIPSASRGNERRSCSYTGVSVESTARISRCVNPGCFSEKGTVPRKSRNCSQHVFFTKFFQPNAQVSLIRHAAIIPEWEKADGKSREAKRKISRSVVLLFLRRKFVVRFRAKIRGKPQQPRFQSVAHGPQHFRASLAQTLFRGLRDRVQHGLRMLPQGRRRSQQPGIRSIFQPRFIGSMASSFDFFSCSIHTFFSDSRCDSHCSSSGPNSDCRCTVACSTPCIMRSSIVF